MVSSTFDRQSFSEPVDMDDTLVSLRELRLADFCVHQGQAIAPDKNSGAYVLSRSAQDSTERLWSESPDRLTSEILISTLRETQWPLQLRNPGSDVLVGELSFVLRRFPRAVDKDFAGRTKYGMFRSLLKPYSGEEWLAFARLVLTYSHQQKQMEAEQGFALCHSEHSFDQIAPYVQAGVFDIDIIVGCIDSGISPDVAFASIVPRSN